MSCDEKVSWKIIIGWQAYHSNSVTGQQLCRGEDGEVGKVGQKVNYCNLNQIQSFYTNTFYSIYQGKNFEVEKIELSVWCHDGDELPSDLIDEIGYLGQGWCCLNINSL